MGMHQDWLRVGGAAVFLLAGGAHAATSLSDSLTDPIGYSLSPTTQATLAAAGLDFASTAGPDSLLI